MSSPDKNPIIDVVIPAHSKDLDTLEHCIKGARNNIQNVRRIIVVSKEKYTDLAEWFGESLYPFSFDEVASFVGVGSAGWYLQQLLKLYAPLVIPDISENVLVLDADTVFMRKVKMISDDGFPLYNISKDQNILYNPFYQRTAKHASDLLPELNRENLPEEFGEISGISHHMLFQRKVIQDLFSRVEAHDKDKDPFYKIFLKHADSAHSASEYNIYFWFILINYFEDIRFRKLKYKNTSDFNLWKYKLRKKYHYCSFHSYMREKKSKAYPSFIPIIIFKIKGLIKKLFLITSWNVGFANCKIENFLSEENIKITWFNNSRYSSFIADSFGFKWHDGNKYVIYELYDYRDRIGKIAVSKLSDNFELIEEKIIVSDKIHSSYPYVFQDQNKFYLIMERNKSNSLELYELLSPYEITKVKNILENIRVVDPTIIKHNNIWWLFFNIYEKGDKHLYIAYSEDLTGAWKMHRKNPVKTDIKSSRPAGTPFIFEENLFRPAQNGFNNYGGSIVINKITKLSCDDFEEEFYKEIFPDKNSEYNRGMHTISAFGDITLVDGKKIKFSPFKFFISLERAIIKIPSKIKKWLVN